MVGYLGPGRWNVGTAGTNSRVTARLVVAKVVAASELHLHVKSMSRFSCEIQQCRWIRRKDERFMSSAGSGEGDVRFSVSSSPA